MFGAINNMEDDMTKWNRVLCATLLPVWLFGISQVTHADEQHMPAKGQFYFSPGIVWYDGPDSDNIGYDDHEAGVGLILGYSFTDHWAAEFLFGRVESEFDNTFGSGEDDIDLKWLDVVYKLESGGGWQPFVLFGGGRSEYNFDNVRSDTNDTQFNLGFGVFRSITDNLAFRADVRGVTSDKSDTNLSSMAFLGLTGFLGQGATPRPPADADGDGVPNDDDQCPTTPPGRVVDATGCELDGDGDGVVDGEDDCPNTPAGVEVNSRGCALDSDGDGVPDYRDECPDTERGARVDEKGCYVELEEEVTIDMNIEFGVDQAQIRPDHYEELNRAVKFLREYPKTNAVIEGHTDSDGAESYNQGLSERRARAVYNWLITEAKIASDRLTWAGYGETQPIDTNETAAGKQRNRRVTAVVSGTHTVRQ